MNFLFEYAKGKLDLSSSYSRRSYEPGSRDDAKKLLNLGEFIRDGVYDFCVNGFR